jgi:hypothetical protein
MEGYKIRLWSSHIGVFGDQVPYCERVLTAHYLLHEYQWRGSRTGRLFKLPIRPRRWSLANKHNIKYFTSGIATVTFGEENKLKRPSLGSIHFITLRSKYPTRTHSLYSISFCFIQSVPGGKVSILEVIVLAILSKNYTGVSRL